MIDLDNLAKQEIVVDWKLAEAKNRFSEVYRLVESEGPQRITKQGSEPVIIITESEYKRLKASKPSFIEFLMNGPDFSDLDLTRDRSPMRDVEL
jgi:prevent-host-death family protein